MVILALMLTACGQNGPLFLPEDATANPPAREPADQDGQESEDDEQDDRALT